MSGSVEPGMGDGKAVVSDLLVKLERRQQQLLEQERRARFERETLAGAIRLLRVGEDEDIVRARLKAKGVIVGVRLRSAAEDRVAALEDDMRVLERRLEGYGEEFHHD
jgi:hypothetical protein